MEWQPNGCTQNSRHRMQKPTHKNPTQEVFPEATKTDKIKWFLNFLSILTLLVQWNQIPVIFSFVFMWPWKSVVLTSVKILFKLSKQRNYFLHFYKVYPKISFGNFSGLKSVPQKHVSWEPVNVTLLGKRVSVGNSELMWSWDHPGLGRASHLMTVTL